MSPMQQRAEYFWRKVDRGSEDRCWPWTGWVGKDGYVTTYVRREISEAVGRPVGASIGVHRLAWALTHGPVPPGLHIDHLCHTKSCRMGSACPHRICCNPAHLQAVTPAANLDRSTLADVTRARHAAVTHCPRGHPYDEANTYRTKDGARRCRTCVKAASARSRARKKVIRVTDDICDNCKQYVPPEWHAAHDETARS